jgi:hypothetical protein
MKTKSRLPLIRDLSLKKEPAGGIEAFLKRQDAEKYRKREQYEVSTMSKRETSA